MVNNIYFINLLFSRCHDVLYSLSCDYSKDGSWSFDGDGLENVLSDDGTTLQEEILCPYEFDLVTNLSPKNSVAKLICDKEPSINDGKINLTYQFLF